MKTPKFRRNILSSILITALSITFVACSSQGGTENSATPGNISINSNQLEVLQPDEPNVGKTLPYPERSAFQIKAIQTDSWENRQELLDANLGGVAINLHWRSWEPVKKTEECDNQLEIRFGGHCFKIDKRTDEQIKFWSSRGVLVTAVLWGVPDWANIGDLCQPARPSLKPFCATANSGDFGRFAGMLAARYNGLKGFGRIADFVIHNEVNMNSWFNAGCGNGVACDVENWISTYTRDFVAAYDAIKKRQPAAKVFIPFAHQFDYSFDKPSASNPIISVKTFISRFSQLVGNRKWRVAYHPYPPSLRHAAFGAEDLPRVTYGNIGVLAGWLRSEFPQNPESWEIHLTESGVNSIWLYSSEQEQADAICDSFRNILGTPGIENYVYHRMVDHQFELRANTGFGLRNEDGSPKQSWHLWSKMSGRNGQYQNLDCGFEDIPYTRLTEYRHATRHPWASTRIPPGGYAAKESWKLLRDFEEGTVMLYECEYESGTYVSLDVHCAGELSYGPLGYAYIEPRLDSVPLHSCSNDRGEIYTSSSDSCGFGETREFLGFVTK